MSVAIRANLSIARKLIFSHNKSSIAYAKEDEQFEFKIGDDEVLCVGADGITCAGFPEPPYGVTVLNESVGTTITDVNVSGEQSNPLVVSKTSDDWQVVKNSYWHTYPYNVSSNGGTISQTQGSLVYETPTTESCTVWLDELVKLEPESTMQVTFSFTPMIYATGTNDEDFLRIGLFASIPTAGPGVLSYPVASIILETSRGFDDPDAWHLGGYIGSTGNDPTPGPFLTVPSLIEKQTFRFIIKNFTHTKIDVYQLNNATVEFEYIMTKILEGHMGSTHFFFANQISDSGGAPGFITASMLRSAQIKTSASPVLYAEPKVYRSKYDPTDVITLSSGANKLYGVRGIRIKYATRMNNFFLDSIALSADGGVNPINYVVQIWRNCEISDYPDWEEFDTEVIYPSEIFGDLTIQDESIGQLLYSEHVSHPVSTSPVAQHINLNSHRIICRHKDILFVVIIPKYTNMIIGVGFNWHI